MIFLVRNVSTFVCLLFFMTYSFSGKALVSVESLILGKNFLEKEDSIKDPLNYVFTPSISDSENQLLMQSQVHVWNASLALEACEKNFKIEFPSEEDKNQAKRSLLATLQYIGIDLSMRAIVSYAELEKFSDEEFENMISQLVGNYCSANLTIISHYQLKKNFLAQRKMKEQNFLPLFKKNKIFPSSLSKWDFDENEQVRRHEFSLALESFKSFCSWGEDTKSLRLMGPFANDPILMAFVIDQLAGYQVKWNSKLKSIEKFKAPDKTVQVACKGLLCRRLSSLEFEKIFPKILGSTERKQNDYLRLWCQEVKDQSYNIQGERTTIRKMILSRTLSDEYLLRSYMVSLLIGMPSFITKIYNFEDLKKIYETSLDEEWKDWALKSLNSLSLDLLFEESVSFERVGKKNSIDYHSFADLSFDFDVNLGEFDRMNQMLGKIKVEGKIKIPEISLIDWLNEYNSILDRETSSKESFEADKSKLFKRMSLTLEDQVSTLRGMFKIPPWEGDLVGLLVPDLIEQLRKMQKNGVKLDKKTQDVVEIPLKIRYGLYALKYLNYRQSALKRDGTIR